MAAADSLQTEYEPPSSAEMIDRQNELDALRLLVAQRQLYSGAKRWLGLRWLGMLAIGLAAPVVAVIWPHLGVAAGAVAGLWLFLGRTILVAAQSSTTAKAAAIQEQFDLHVFGMPERQERLPLPSLEEISAIAGPDSGIAKVADEQKLLDWYPINADDSGATSVAISLRANAAYADRLLRKTAHVWGVATAAWVALLIMASVIANLSLLTFLLGVLLPVLPAFLDVVQYVVDVRRAGRKREQLARSIERRLNAEGGVVKGEALLQWQDAMYDLRRSAPQVPDLLYKIDRQDSERAMRSAASQLARRFRRSV